MKDIKDKIIKKFDQILNTEYGSGMLGRVMSVLGLIFVIGFIIVGIAMIPVLITAVEKLQSGDPVYIEFFIMVSGSLLSWLVGLIYGIKYVKDKTTALIDEIFGRLFLCSFIYINAVLIVVDLFVIKSVTGFFSGLFFVFSVIINLFLMYLWCMLFSVIGVVVVGIILFSIKALLHVKSVKDRRSKIGNSSLYKKISSCIENDLHIVKSVVITDSEVKVIFEEKDARTFVFKDEGFSNLDTMGFSIIIELLQNVCKGFKLEKLKESIVLGNPKYIKNDKVKKVEPKKEIKEVKVEKEDW